MRDGVITDVKIAAIGIHCAAHHHVFDMLLTARLGLELL
jgi:hypothetical protein